MSDPNVTEKTALLDGPVIPAPLEATSRETAKASHDMLEVLRNIHATIENKMQAVADAAKTARETNRVYNPALDPRGDVAEARGIADITQDVADTDLKVDLCRAADAVAYEWLLRNHLARRNNATPVKHEECGTWRAYSRLLKRANVWTGGAGIGAEWKPTGISTLSLDLFRLDAAVPSLFDSIEIPQGIGALSVPQFSSAASVAVVAAADGATTTLPTYGGAGTVTTPGSTAFTLTPVKHGTLPMAFGNEMNEDLAAPVIPAVTREIEAALIHGWESGIINGQATTNDANLDGANGPAAANGYSNGLRWYTIYSTGGASANVLDLSGGTFNLDAAADAWAKLGNFGLNPSTLAWILSATMWYSIATDAQVRAVDYAGPIATLPRGTLALLFGIPVVPTQNILNCLATGKIGASANTSTMGLLVNRSRFRKGLKRSLDVHVFDFPGSDSVGMRGFARHCLAWLKPDTDKHSVAIINTPA